VGKESSPPNAAAVSTHSLVDCCETLRVRQRGNRTRVHPPLWSVRGVLDAIATNVVAFAALWTATAMTLVFLRVLGVLHSDMLNLTVVIIALSACVVVSLRLRARLTSLVFGSVFVVQLVGLLAAISKDILPQGWVFYHTPLASFPIALIGIGLGLLIARGSRSAGAAKTVAHAAAESQDDVESQGLDRADTRQPFLRLRAIFAS
jgi:hypothetical protein